MAKAIAFSPDMLDALRNLGLDTDNVARVIIDIQSGQPVRLYVTMFGDKRAVRVAEALLGNDVEIVHTGEEQAEVPA